MAVSETVKGVLKDDALWAVAFIGVCVLVGMGKLKPETVEYMLFAVVGRAAAGKPKKEGE